MFSYLYADLYATALLAAAETPTHSRNFTTTSIPFSCACDSAAKDMQNMKDRNGICPVCHKVFHAKAHEHVLDLVGAHSQLTKSKPSVCSIDPKSVVSDVVVSTPLAPTLNTSKGLSGQNHPTTTAILTPMVQTGVSSGSSTAPPPMAAHKMQERKA
ncbi:hypothetical protein Tco_1180825 [Tanacetum coccineum]